MVVVVLVCWSDVAACICDGNWVALGYSVCCCIDFIYVPLVDAAVVVYLDVAGDLVRGGLRGCSELH